MPDSFYAHRLSRVLDELVVKGGLTLQLSDETSDIALHQNLDNIRILCQTLNIEMQDQISGDRCNLVFRRRG